MNTPEHDLAHWLVSGGDERLALDLATGLNMYGCGAVPRPDDIAFSSSTASTITASTALAVESFWAELVLKLAGEGHPTEVGEGRLYAQELGRVRQKFRDLMNLPGIEMVMAASGTDIHLFAALLLNRVNGRPLVTFTLMGNETGSAVPKASAGKHFMAQHGEGVTVKVGSEVGHGEGIRNISFSVRQADGALRSEVELEDELSGQMAELIAGGSRCLLIVADVTKTGLIAPGLETVFKLKARFGDALDIMIDACQFRLSAATIQAYLRHNFLVAVTGSKFLSGPVFSGALLCSPQRSADLRHHRLPDGLRDYCTRADWPDGWIAKRHLPEKANWGLLLRWKAALIELEAFASRPDAQVRSIVSAFGAAVQKRLSMDPAFVALETRPIDRSAVCVTQNVDDLRFDELPTIFTFYLCHPVRGDLLTPSETAEVYQALRSGFPRVQLGQPVASGADFSALRLCLSAPLICQACASDTALEDLMAQAMRVLDQVVTTVSEIVTIPQSKPCQA